MTDTTERQLPTAPSADLQIAIRDDATREDRENAERSIAALVSRATAAGARRRAAEAELAQLTNTMNAPFRELIEADSAANTALETLSAREPLQVETMEELRPGSPRRISDVRPPTTEADSTLRSTGFVPPYDFSWSWHDGNGGAPFGQMLDRPSGRVGLDARSGQVPGGASGFVNAHAGFGVFLRADSTGQRFPHAVLNPGRFSFALGAIGIGSNATSEGGFELTVFEDGRFLAGASLRLWRSRVSGSFTSPSESTSGGQGNHLITGPELQFTMRQGHGYTFNAGIWAYSDRSTGVGAGAVQSLLEGFVTRMWVFG